MSLSIQYSRFDIATSPVPGRLDRFGPTFAGADAETVLQIEDENLAVADAAFGTGATGFHNCVYRRFDEIFVDGDLQLHLAQQVQSQFVTAINFGMALLPAETEHVHDRQTKDLDFRQGFFHGL